MLSLCENWCHVSCSYQTHLGRVCPCHIGILDPKRKIMVLSHPCLEDYVALPTRRGIRIPVKQSVTEIDHKAVHQDVTISRRCAARWINVLVEKHAWLSTGLICIPEAPETGRPVKMDNHSQLPLASMSVISLFEFWGEGVQLVRSLDAHRFHFPQSLAVMNPWSCESTAWCLSMLWESLRTL